MQELTNKQKSRRLYYQTHREVERERHIRWVENHREYILNYYREYNRIHSEEKREYYAKAKAIYQEHWREHRINARKAILERMGNKCIKCGFSDPRALNIDHINNDGHLCRNRSGKASFYRQLLRLPDIELFTKYQLLCANCNQIKRCEHEKWLAYHLPHAPTQMRLQT